MKPMRLLIFLLGLASMIPGFAQTDLTIDLTDLRNGSRVVDSLSSTYVGPGETRTISGEEYRYNNIWVNGGTVILRPGGRSQDIYFKSLNVINGGVVRTFDTVPASTRIRLINATQNEEERTISVMGAGSRLTLLGQAKYPFLQLAASTAPGDQVIIVHDSVGHGWRNGYFVVIAASGYDSEQSEERQIRSIAAYGTDYLRINLNKPLDYIHYGDSVAGDEWKDCEVINLTRNIQISGNNAANASDRGPNIIVHMGAVAQLHGVQVAYGGWRSQQGRYPIHFHLTGNSSSSFIKYCSVHNSNHRGIVVHQADSVIVTDNALHDIWSHGIAIAEDGKASGNVCRRNVVNQIRQYDLNAGGVRPGEFAFGYDGTLSDGRTSGRSLQRELSPAAIWCTNPNNDISYNHLTGGVSANGLDLDFFMGRQKHSPGLPDQADTKTAGKFSGNVIHSFREANVYSTSVQSRSAYQGKGWAVFADYTQTDSLVVDSTYAYNCHSGFGWIESASTFLLRDTAYGCGTGVNVARGFIGYCLFDRANPTGVSGVANTHDFGGFNIVNKEDACAGKIAKGKIVINACTVNGYEYGVFIENPFEPYFFIDSLSGDFDADKRIRWQMESCVGVEGVIHDYDSNKTMLYNGYTVEAYVGVEIQDTTAGPSCTQLRITSPDDFYTTQETLPWVPCYDTSAFAYFLPSSQITLTQATGGSTKKYVKAWGFDGDSVRVGGVWYQAQQPPGLTP